MQNVKSVLEEFENKHYWLKQYWLRKKLKKIPDQLIIEQIGMADMPKIIHILKKKYRKNVIVLPIENDLMLRVKKTNVANMSYLAVYLHFLAITNYMLHIEGNISIPDGLRNYAFYVRVNGKKTEVKLENCGLDLKLNGEVYERRMTFCIDIYLTEYQYSIEFFNEVDGIECRCSRINSLRFSPIADCIKGQYFASHEWVVQIHGNKIICHKSNKRECIEYEKNYQNEIKLLNESDTDWVLALRKKYFEMLKTKKKPIWLIMDRNDRADDNGEVFFKYMQQHDEVDTYFVIDEQCDDYKRLQSIGKVIPLYSEKHYLLALLAECVISSQCNGWVENPFWEKAEYFRDLYHRANLIFLQHGVIKDDMSSTLNRFHTNLKGFVVSTVAEYQSILDYPYYYGKESIWLTGLPIFDELKNNEQGYIVIAPTWRMGLMHQEWDEESKKMTWVPNANIRNSEYYQVYRELLKEPKLQECCQRNNYKLVFKPHPLMEKYIKDIVEGTDVLLMGAETSYRDMVSMGNLLVTDYSSIAFEFAYLGKSTLYYQFDRNNFFTSHTYNRGYFNYEKDGFGEVCYSKIKLISRLIEYIENGCTVKEKYKTKIQQLYPVYGGVCKRLYEQIRQLCEEKNEHA